MQDPPIPPPALQPVRADEPHLRHPQRGLHHHLHPGDGPQARGVQGQGECHSLGPRSRWGWRGDLLAQPPPPRLQPHSAKGPASSPPAPACSPLGPCPPSDAGQARRSGLGGTEQALAALPVAFDSSARGLHHPAPSRASQSGGCGCPIQTRTQLLAPHPRHVEPQGWAWGRAAPSPAWALQSCGWAHCPCWQRGSSGSSRRTSVPPGLLRGPLERVRLPDRCRQHHRRHPQ